MLASLYLGLGIVISLYTADKLNHVAEGLGKFSYGLMFGWGLLMILYMNAELGTSNMMYMTVASHRKRFLLKQPSRCWQPVSFSTLSVLSLFVTLFH